MSSIEVLGQILRNFTGTLTGERKLTLLKTVYALGLRWLRAVLGVAEEATLVPYRNVSTEDLQAGASELSKNLERYLSAITLVLGTSTFRTLSISIGSTDIEESLYADTLDQVGRTNATALLDLAVRLDHFEAYPYEGNYLLDESTHCCTLKSAVQSSPAR